MPVILFAAVLLISYLIGAIPFGWLIVRLRTGKDIRSIESGRTGGTNAMRAAGFAAGFATAILDLLKAASTVWLARAIFPESNAWLEVVAPIMAVLGHNYSIFLLERGADGKIRLRGGAGGAPATGGAFGLDPVSILFVLPVGVLALYGIGYASVATMSVALTATVYFAIKAILGQGPWQYIFYGIFSGALLVIALRPNIRRLMNGTERLVGWRAKRLKNRPPA